MLISHDLILNNSNEFQRIFKKQYDKDIINLIKEDFTYLKKIFDKEIKIPSSSMIEKSNSMKPILLDGNMIEIRELINLFSTIDQNRELFIGKIEGTQKYEISNHQSEKDSIIITLERDKPNSENYQIQLYPKNAKMLRTLHMKLNLVMTKIQ